MLTCVTSMFPWTSPSVCTPCPSDCTYSELWGHAIFLSCVTASHIVKVLAQKWHPQCCSNMTTLVQDISLKIPTAQWVLPSKKHLKFRPVPCEEDIPTAFSSQGSPGCLREACKFEQVARCPTCPAAVARPPRSRACEAPGRCYGVWHHRTVRSLDVLCTSRSCWSGEQQH